jgi:two-component system alkaline phosphatase synthesis response regulator PhoP
MSNKKLKITIVEDDAPIREMYKLKLEAAGFDVSTANDGASALHVLEHEVPDLILLDIRLPHLPGNEVLKRVRDTDWGENIKCIVLTNISKDEAPAEFRFLNIDRYVVKAHYTPTQVLEIINEVLSGQ